MSAFVDGPRLIRRGRGGGPLSGLRFAAKDLIDVAGRTAGCGNPDWARTHRPARRTAWCVSRLLAAGADLIGMTVTDELAFSLEGANAHHGMPANPRAPGRLPGGSSSGSAVAVANGEADFALGTDTGGSVRVPASFCGVYGFRPSHGRVPLDGVMPFAPSYDTLGWFAPDLGRLIRAGEALLGARVPRLRKRPKLLQPTDIWALADRRAAVVLRPLLDAAPIRLWQRPALDAAACYRVVQGYEIWGTHKAWIARAKPHFGPSIAPRFADAATIGRAEYVAMTRVRAELAAAARALTDPGALLVIPTAPGIAPRPGAVPADFYPRALAINAVAGHAGLPQVTLPLGTLDGCPLGLSLIGSRGQDAFLLAAARLLSL